MLGARLIREASGTVTSSEPRCVGRIVDVEAYIGEGDSASHARFGLTPRTAPMFGRPGIAYVYLVYGMHVCLNVVTEPVGSPAAVLIRAVEPMEGIPGMRAARLDASTRRRADSAAPAADDERVELVHGRLAATPAHWLASGPGLVGAAFGLNTACSGLDLLDQRNALRIEAAPADEPAPTVVAGPRIGIAYAGPDWVARPWRLWIAGHPSLSRPGTRAGAGGLPAGLG